VHIKPAEVMMGHAMACLLVLRKTGHVDATVLVLKLRGQCKAQADAKV
jgi:hypothetical protein